MGVCGCAAVCGLLSAGARGEIRYTLSLAHPEQHVLRVTMEVPDVKEQVRLQMAAWNALYMIRDFSSHVQEVDATVNGERATIEKVDKLTWRVQGSGTVRVTYATFWDDVGPFATQLNAEHAFINPAMVLMYVPERRQEAVRLEIGNVAPEWKVAAGTAAGDVQSGANGTWTLKASGFDELADDPIEASKFEEFTLKDMTPPVRVVIHGDNYNKREVESALRKICGYELRLMEGAPYTQYTFVFHTGRAAAGGGGGMEHANSTAIFAPTETSLTSIAAHEFFHLWNVKRIRPSSLEPVDYTHEMYTRSLWFAEGVTSTYGSYALERTGLWNKQEFYQDLSEQISELEGRPANRWQSAEQSSLDAWLEKYALYTQPSRSVSYYTKGQVLGVLLDLEIRKRTGDRKSLDDVLRAMDEEFAKQGKFYRDSLDVKLTAERVVGGSFDEFFEKYVSGTEPLPYAEVLGYAGLELKVRESSRATLGFVVDRGPDGALAVTGIDAESPAAKSGLHVGDQVLRWNDGDVPRRLERWAAGQKAGDEVRLHIKRGETEEDVVVRLGELRTKVYEVEEMGKATEEEKRVREGWLKGVEGK